MAATWTLLSKPVGPGIRASKSNIRTVQQLLTAAGYDTGGAAGTWDQPTTRALLAFREEHLPGPYRLEIQPDSEELVLMARLAGVEIPLPGTAGMDGVRRMHDWFVARETKYNDGAESGLGNRAIYGIQGWSRSAIQRINQAWRRGPIQMDCTTYVNLMLGIFTRGDAHGPPYDATCADYGGLSEVHCARDRYAFNGVSAKFGKEVRAYITTADEMAAVAKENTLYALEVANSSNSVDHMALLYSGEVMECTVKQTQSACIKRSVTDFMRGKRARIFMYEQPS